MLWSRRFIGERREQLRPPSMQLWQRFASAGWPKGGVWKNGLNVCAGSALSPSARVGNLLDSKSNASLAFAKSGSERSGAGARRWTDAGIRARPLACFTALALNFGVYAA